jgi:hypothetical protein
LSKLDRGEYHCLASDHRGNSIDLFLHSHGLEPGIGTFVSVIGADFLSLYPQINVNLVPVASAPEL